MPVEKRTITKVAVASLIGTTIDWYDFFLYGIVAGLVFDKLYFPSHDPLVGTMLAYATFGVGFIARPVGGILFGHFGDRVGRKSMLVLTLGLMGVATFLIGVIPTYDSIGVWAPALLLLCRVVQGLGLGGEWGGAVLMTFEYAPENRRGFYASLPQIGVGLGLCMGAGITALLSTVLSNDAFFAWGWRIAFMLSAVLVFVGLYIRLTIQETPAFAKIKKDSAEAKIPFLDLAKRYPGNILKGMGVRYIEGVFFNVFAVFSISYLTQTLKINRTEALLGVMVAALVMCFFIPFFGAVSDRYGRIRTYVWGTLVTAFSSLPAFWLMANYSGSVVVVWLAIIIPFGIFYAAIYGPEAALFCELFDTKVRYSGISFVYQFSGIFASGITPMIATALLKTNGGRPWHIVAYVIFAGLVSAYSGWLISRASRQRLSY
jgi:metabolite-proton symporter